MTADESWAGRGWWRLQFDKEDVELMSCATQYLLPPALPLSHLSASHTIAHPQAKSQKAPAIVALNP